MRIAFTADVHLEARGKTPERWNALENILEQMASENIKTLVIAGDLFEKDSQNYSEFDSLSKQAKYGDIKFYIIPGNHDSGITPKSFTAKNIEVFTEPVKRSFGEPALDMIFLPYCRDKSMGESLAEYKNKNGLPARWMLVGHGDYLSGVRAPNAYEPGVYMPLGRCDVELYGPAGVILGHIHKKNSVYKVTYTGSPCGLDINETGIRSYLILDTDTRAIEARSVVTDRVFFSETLTALPIGDEFEYARKKTEELTANFGFSKKDIPRIRLRLKVKGYTTDKPRLLAVVKEALEGYKFYNDEEPDMSEVATFSEPERARIVEKVKEAIDALEWKDGGATEERILEEALHIVLKE